MSAATSINLDAPIGALKTQLSKLLLSIDRVGWLTGTTAGRFDVRRTSRMLAGSEHVFKARTETPATTTAVSIVVDLSSSMDDVEPPAGWVKKDYYDSYQPKEGEHVERSRIAVASQCAYAISTAVERSNCEVEVVGFGCFNTESNFSTKGLHDTAGENSKRADSASYAQARLIDIKPFSQRTGIRRRAFEFLHKAARFGTPDYHAIRTVTEGMVQRSEHRKICIVITDGMGDMARMKQFVKFSEKHYNIPVLGIGISTDPEVMKLAYDQYACVRSVSELSETAIRSLIEQVQNLGKK